MGVQPGELGAGPFKHCGAAVRLPSKSYVNLGLRLSVCKMGALQFCDKGTDAGNEQEYASPTC